MRENEDIFLMHKVRPWEGRESADMLLKQDQHKARQQWLKPYHLFEAGWHSTALVHVQVSHERHEQAKEARSSRGSRSVPSWV